MSLFCIVFEMLVAFFGADWRWCWRVWGSVLGKMASAPSAPGSATDKRYSEKHQRKKIPCKWTFAVD